jgi:hypothetical protein
MSRDSPSPAARGIRTHAEAAREVLDDPQKVRVVRLGRLLPAGRLQGGGGRAPSGALAENGIELKVAEPRPVSQSGLSGLTANQTYLPCCRTACGMLQDDLRNAAGWRAECCRMMTWNAAGRRAACCVLRVLLLCAWFHWVTAPAKYTPCAAWRV